MKPPLYHVIENSKDLRAQFNSHSIKLQHLVWFLSEEGLGWEVGGKIYRQEGPAEGRRDRIQGTSVHDSTAWSYLRPALPLWSPPFP